MKAVIACDSFKGCLSSKEVKEIITRSIKAVDPSIDVVSYVIGDGGEGSVEAFCECAGGVYQDVSATDAYGRPITTKYAWIENHETAVIEVANIIGLSMHERDKRTPFFGSSYGVGSVILDALQQGCKKIIINLGGSATNDGGMGLLQALGARFYDQEHAYLSPQAMNLENIKFIDFNRLVDLSGVEIIAACDVKNHLLGKEGATFVFGKQKGFYPNQIKKVEEGMVNFRDQVLRYTNKDLDSCIGGGAAGGIGATLIMLLNASMTPGIELLLSFSDIEEQIKTCDFVITGEGQSDKQTMYGKVPVGILNIAKKFHKPTVCISGALGLGYHELYELGFAGIYSIADRAMTFQQAIELAGDKLYMCAYAVVKTIVTFSPNSSSGK